MPFQPGADQIGIVDSNALARLAFGSDESGCIVDLSEPSNGEENAATDFAVEEEVKISLTQRQAKLTERIKSAYADQLESKEQLIKDLERQLGVMTSETDEKMKAVEELVGLLNAINNLLTELEKEVEKYTQLDDRGELAKPLAKGRLLELEQKVSNLRPDVSRC